MEHIEITERCWLWTGPIKKNGYGWLTVNGKHRYAHVFAYEAFDRPVPDGLEVDHLCEIKRCVCPADLEPVTHAENVRRFRSGHPERFQEGQTRCKHGHLFDTANTIVLVGGRRKCRECHRRISRDYARKKREAAHAR